MVDKEKHFHLDNDTLIYHRGKGRRLGAEEFLRFQIELRRAKNRSESSYFGEKIAESVDQRKKTD